MLFIDDKMAASSEFIFCEICRFNHTDCKKHVYCKRHKNEVDKILVRFKAKVNEAVATIKSPLIKGEPFEVDVNVWCYFCKKDVPKHLFCGTEDGITVCYHSFLNHLKSFDHLKKTKTFWWNNRVDFNRLEQFILKNEEFERFKEKSLELKEEQKRKQKDRRDREVERILQVDEQRKDIVRLTQTSFDSSSRTNISDSNFIASTSKISETNEEVSNIFTGMVPPWLQDDEEAESAKKEVHPNENDYEKHLKLKKKNQLPSNRVGANFDHESSKPADWLPSFGRVWNNGRRQASKQQFERESSSSIQQHKKKHCVRTFTKDDDDPAFPKAAAARPPPNLNKYIL